jgi:DNA-binding transcriptional regulator PaaX
VIIYRLPASKRRELRKALAWQRFSNLTTGVLAYPRSDPADILALLMDMALQDQNIVFETTQQHPLGQPNSACHILRRLRMAHDQMLQSCFINDSAAWSDM